jgi:hypothetical protein
VLRLRRLGRRLHVRPGDRARRLRRRGRAARRRPASSSPTPPPARVGAGPPQAARRGDGAAVDWYHDRLLNDPDGPPGARLPPQSRVVGRRRPAVQAGMGSRRLGRAGARARRAGRSACARSGSCSRTGAGPHRRTRSGPACCSRSSATRARPIGIGGRVLPGSDDPAKYKNSPETPIYTKSKTLYGLNWAKGDIVAADQAIVCEGYTDVIGFHRAGLAAGGGHVRHGVHRGARPAAQAVHEPRRARVRRRRRRSGCRRALLRVGGEVPGRGERGPVPGRPGPGRPRPERPRRARAPRSTTHCRSSRSGSTG